LLLYRGVAMVMMMGENPSLLLEQVDQQLFGGSSILRTGLYAVSHTVLGVSMTSYVLKLYSVLRQVGSSQGRSEP